MSKMNLDYDINKKVLNLESLGRKICSDLRNLQKERIILSREAKSLLREFEREETQRDHNKNKKDNNKPCSCAIWENDIRKEDKNEAEGPTKLITQDEIFYKNFCNECCQHCVPRHDSNMILQNYRYDEPFYCDHALKNIDYFCIGDNVMIKDDANGDNNFNDTDELDKYNETRTINPSYFYDLCVFCDDDNMEDTHVLSTNHKISESKKTDMKELIERQRGGGENSNSESTIDKLSSQSICTCECDLCTLRNKYGERPPCSKESNEIDRSFDIDNEDNVSINQATCLELPEISQVTITRVFRGEKKNKKK
ncbi:uncharacterized protein LOC124951319 isoform X2 [Vespa velutina]|uniref:uncharacterized protein LOC124951319 isoform X2 n=1 Tax=Vespa velutina TaxID=202808 RepID=UPI001FB2C039|nr:uncharacterized protein LOC124951319 isoform X2 [Vespa velutina]